MDFVSTLCLVLLAGIVYPMSILMSYKKVNENILRDDKYRLSDYKHTLLLFWIQTFFILINYVAFKTPIINFYPKFTSLNLWLIVLIVGFAIVQHRLTNKVKNHQVNNLKEHLKDIYYYLPKTRKELQWFIFLSVSAGFCEEIIFRVFLFEFLKSYSSIIFAFITTNLIFAITHIGSGIKNTVSSFILGLLFQIIIYLTENIWAAILLHIIIDINIGILGYKINQSGKLNNQELHE